MAASDSFDVRRATRDDAALVGQLLAEFNTEFETPSPVSTDLARRFTSLLSREDVLVLLVEEDAPVGFAFLTLRPTPYGDGPLAQLEELYVRPFYRDRGVGSVLLDAMFAELGEYGAVRVDSTMNEVDIDTRRFYERQGFVNTEPGSGMRTLLYSKELRAN